VGRETGQEGVEVVVVSAIDRVVTFAVVTGCCLRTALRYDYDDRETKEKESCSHCGSGVAQGRKKNEDRSLDKELLFQTV